MSDQQPKALAKNTVEFGKARFTLLTDRMVRLEWAKDGQFEDRATLGVSNRRMPAVSFETTTQGRKLVIQTDALTLRYLDDGKKLSKTNLSIRFRNGRKAVTWTPGLRDRANLKGTYRTLDGCNGDRCHNGKKIPLCDGLISRSGWAVHDDSDAIVLDETIADSPWVAPRPEGTRQDLYFLGYGDDFRAALADSAKVFGHQPLPPRFVFGYWWSRYWEYSDKELEQIVGEFTRFQVPLDVLVIDMDWHVSGWTGYTWDKQLFPNPTEFLSWLKSNDLKITLNLHPADGVARHEEQFEDMARALGVDPKRTKRIEFDCTDPKFVDAYFRVLHHPQEDQGVDFWWMDWQQGENTKLSGLDPLPWINHLHYVDMQDRTPERRPLIFSRFGGLGAGRYPIGFSGDSSVCWETLAYQPYFTATAANVHYGYWSHDIGGHHQGALSGELYLRWVQFGAFSPVLRTHTTKDATYERKVWEYPAPYSHLMVEAINHRYGMVPYIYTECRKVMGNGLSLCRPMYHDYPTDEAAFMSPQQYLFGDEMIVAPVVAPVSDKDEMAEVSVWLPKGKWFDVARGVWETGGKTIARKYMLSEVPQFVRPGAVIPGQKAPQRLTAGSYRDLVVMAYPGGDGSYDLYEDDGVSQAYQDGASATIRLQQKSTKTQRTVTVCKAQGRYDGFENVRSLEVRLPGVGNVKDVTVDGKSLQQAYRLGEKGWAWDATLGGVVIRVPKIDVRKDTQVKVIFAGKEQAALGFAGAASRLDRIRQLGGYACIHSAGDKLARIHADAQAATTRVAMNPDTIDTERRTIRKHLSQMDKALAWRWKAGGSKKDAKPYLDRANAIARDLQNWF